MTYLRIVAWDVLRRILWRAIRIAGLFFFSAWVWMMLWGMVSHASAVASMGYWASALTTLAIWLVVLPVVAMALRVYKPPARDLFD